MDVVSLIREQLKKLGLGQRDLAIGAEVTESYISQLMNRRRPLPAPENTDIYEKLDRVLGFPPGRLSHMLELQRKAEVLRRIGEEVVPLFPRLRDVIVGKCAAGRRAAIRTLFEKQPFGEIERLITQTLVDVARQRVAAHEGDEAWLRATLNQPRAASRTVQARVREFLEADVLLLPQPTTTACLESLIASWDMDLSSFEMRVTLAATEKGRSSKRFHFTEQHGADRSTQEPGFLEFLDDEALSGTATEEELAFLRGIRFPEGRPTPLYFYRELQSIRDPLHVKR